MKYVLGCMGIFLIASSISLALTPSETLFVEKHAVDQALIETLDAHSTELYEKALRVHKTPLQKHGVWIFPWLPDYYIKYNITRVAKAEKIRSCIDSQNLDLMEVAEKKLYHSNGRPDELNNLNYLVIIKKVVPSTALFTPLTLAHIQQLVTIIKKTGHISTARGNYLITNPHKICFIDTDGTFDKQRVIMGLIRLLHNNWETYYTEEALTYIINQIASLFTHMNPSKRGEAEKAIKSLDPALSSRIRASKQEA